MDLLRHLRFFVAVAEQLHYGHAAAELGMTQPPLSQGVRRLEQHLGVRLFDRDARGVRLTEGGRALLPQAEDLLAAADRLLSAAATVGPERPAVRLGLPPDLGGSGATVVGRLRRRLAEHEVTVSTASSQTLVEQVRTGTLDLAVVRHPIVTAGLEVGAVVRVPTWLLLPSDHSQPAPDGADTVRLAEIADLPLALPPRHHHPAAHDLIVDTLRRHGHSGTTLAAGPAEAGIAVAAGRAAALVVDMPALGGELTVHRIADDPLPLRFRTVTAPPPRAGSRAAAGDWARLVESALHDCSGGF